MRRFLTWLLSLVLLGKRQHSNCPPARPYAYGATTPSAVPAESARVEGRGKNYGLKPSNAFIVSLLVGIHLVLAFAYASITPYHTPGRYRDANWAIIPDIGAPDELQHVVNVQTFLNGHLPVLDANDPNLGAHYQAHQPPLFYILAAGWAKVFGYTGLGSQGAGLTLRALNVLIGCANVL